MVKKLKLKQEKNGKICQIKINYLIIMLIRMLKFNTKMIQKNINKNMELLIFRRNQSQNKKI